MFSKSKDSAPNARENESVPAPVKRSSGRSAPGIISVDMTVSGDLRAAGDIQVEGTVAGDIECGSLIVGEKAEIKGNVLAEEVVIRGRVDGSIRARKVTLSSTSHVEGDILHQALAVETGAFFEGNCRHSDDPLNAQIASRPAKGGPAQSRTAAPSPSLAPAQPAVPLASTTSAFGQTSSPAPSVSAAPKLSDAVASEADEAEEAGEPVETAEAVEPAAAASGGGLGGMFGAKPAAAKPLGGGAKPGAFGVGPLRPTFPGAPSSTMKPAPLGGLKPPAGGSGSQGSSGSSRS